MAGVPPIPLLLCNTPPPIDFGEEDDDSSLPPTLTLEDDEEYGDFALAVDIKDDSTNADASSLPHTPIQFELSSSTTSGFTDVPRSLEECGLASITPPPLQPVCSSGPTDEEKKQRTELDFSRKGNGRLQSSEAVRKFVENNITVDTGATTTQSLKNDNKQVNSDSNVAKNTFSSDTALATSPPSSADSFVAISKNEEIQLRDLSTLVDEQEIERKPNIMPIISQSPPPLTSLVLVEDLSDDISDEECHRSPKKCSMSPTSLNSSDDINSVDFFAIHVVNVPPTPKDLKISTTIEDINMNNFSNHNNNLVSDKETTSDSNSNADNEQDDDFGDFADFESAADLINPATFAKVTTTIPKLDSNENVNVVAEPSLDNATSIDGDEFDDFQDFCAAPTATAALTQIISGQNSFEKIATTCEDAKELGETKEEAAAPIETEKTPQSDLEADDLDDDFGDFEEASFATVTNELPSITTMTNAHTPAVTNGNINERLALVLKIMFPKTDGSDASDIQSANDTTVPQVLPDFKSPNTALPFESIEAAKALEFQWAQSEMRHALIRSIGIDSRNILFGENWNPSMPRYAANLSFNPLKPMKAQTASTPTTIFADSESAHYSNSSAGCAADVAINNYSMKTDVPDVEFDWQSSGLVNPLDGIKGETNTRETETIHPSPSVVRFDTSDDQHQPHTTFANIGENISESLSNNDTELTATPTRDVCPTPLTLDKPAYQFTTHDQGIISNSSNSSDNSNSSCASHNKSYDNSNTLTTLRLGANIAADVVDDDDETVVTSTYAGPLKETHIYTPSKTDMAASAAVKTSKMTVGVSKAIDFDYEIAAAGIIIDEKVVKKEYRDVEYNPGFSLEVLNEYVGELPAEVTTSLANDSSETVQELSQSQSQQPPPPVAADTDEFTEFTEFQSVPPPPESVGPTSSSTTITSASQVETNNKSTNMNVPPVLPTAVSKAKESSNTPSRTNSPSTIDNMILSPAILLPQAISISSNNTLGTKAAPSIEWGDTTANINPDELARIEELFPQPKLTAAKDANSSQKSSPVHAFAENQAKNASISISASVAMKELDSTLNDDYWSEFVSVPVTQQSNNASRLNNNSCSSNIKSNNNNNQLVITPKRNINIQLNSAKNTNNARRSPRQQQHVNIQRALTPTTQRKPTPSANINTNGIPYNSNSNINSNSNDDDWSDFVSSTPAAPTHSSSCTPIPYARQFNSAAWQNANFYNNPLGLYHQQVTANSQVRATPLTPQQQQLQLQQQIHIMQDFSTAPVITRPNVAMNNVNNANISNHSHSNSYSPLQVGNARVAPSISLIPDLGFVAPAMPVHTAFVNVLPKTSYNGKK